MKPRTPAEVFPPGEFIRDELEERGWTQGDLAKIMGRPEPSINLIINDKRGITPETANELSAAFGTSAEFWLSLDAAYRLSKTSDREALEEIRERAKLFESSPVKEMEKRGWISPTNSIVDLRRELASFYDGFDVETFKVAARASTETEQGTVTPEQIAWCVQALRLAARLPTGAFDLGKLHACKKKLRELAAFPEGVARVPSVLADYGIRFVVVEHLVKTKIDGAALWLGTGWDKPVIAMSVRFDRIDSFWHTLCHEFSHIKNRDSVALVDVDLFADDPQTRGKLKSEIEQRADKEAVDMLIPREKLDSFILRKRPYFSKVSIIQFANAQKIHPGIVAGQLHHRLGAYKTNREMLVKVREIITSRALTDGWGVQIAK